MAQKTWEMSNNVETISSMDDIYRYDKKQQQDMLTTKPWEKEYVPSFIAITVSCYFQYQRLAVANLLLKA